MTDDPISPKHPWMKFASAGIELAGTTLGVAAIGYALDRYLQSQRPIGTAVGLLVGFAFGMFRFIRLAMQPADTPHPHSTSQKQRSSDTDDTPD